VHRIRVLVSIMSVGVRVVAVPFFLSVFGCCFFLFLARAEIVRFGFSFHDLSRTFYFGCNS